MADLENVVREIARDEIARYYASPDHSPLLYSPGRAAQILDVDPSTLWRWRKKGLITATVIEGKTMYSRAEITRMIEQFTYGD